MIIRGRVIFNELEGGAWAIEDEKGEKWRPVNMPDQLKIEGAAVTVHAKELEGESFIMWGNPVKIVSFHTVPRF